MPNHRQINVNPLYNNSPISDMDISRSTTLLAWEKTAQHEGVKNVSQQLRNYFNLLTQRSSNNVDEQQPPFKSSGLETLESHRATQQAALNDEVKKTVSDFHRHLQTLNVLTIQDSYDLQAPHSRHLLHSNFDESARTIALNGMGELLECPGRLWVAELQQSAKKRTKNFFLGMIHAFLPVRLLPKSTAYRGKTPPSFALFDKKRNKLIKQFDKIQTIDEQIQWLHDKALAIQPILDKLTARIDVLEAKKHELTINLQTLVNKKSLSEKYQINGHTFQEYIIPGFVQYRRDKEAGMKNAVYGNFAAKNFIKNLFGNDTFPLSNERIMFEKQLEAYLTLDLQAYETKRLGQSFFAIQSHLEAQEKAISMKKMAFDNANEQCIAAKKQEALILFQRYIACQYEFKHGDKSMERHAALNELEKQLTQSLGIHTFWPWHYAWHWLTFHLLHAVSTLVGGRYFKRLYALRQRINTSGRFSVICKLMLKKNYLLTEYNSYTQFIQEALYGTSEEDFYNNSIVGYHASLLANSDENNAAALKEVEHVICLLNQSPFFKVINNEKSGFIFSDRENKHPITIRDKNLQQKVLTLLADRKDRETWANFQHITRSLEQSLCNTWSNYIGHHLLSYNGFSLKQAIDALSGKSKLDRMNRDIHDFVRTLRSLGCRQDVARLYFYLQKIQNTNNRSSEEKMDEFFAIMKNIFEQFNGTDFTVDHSYRHKFTLTQVKNFVGFGNKSMNATLKDRLFLNTLKKQMNRIFEQYGYHERIQRTLVDGVPRFSWVAFDNTSQGKMKERVGKKWWRVIADFITIGNTAGQAFFAALASFLHGNIPLGCLILVASAAANFLLLVNAQRFAFIQLFVKGTITDGMSTVRKMIFYSAMLLCVIAGIFVGTLAGAGAVATFTQLGIPLVLVFINALTVGTFVAIGMGSLFFFTSGMLIKNYDGAKVWNYFHSTFLFKGFLDKTMGQKIIYLISWAANVLILPVFFFMALLYTGASLGLGFDQSIKILQHVPKLTTTAIYVIAGVFVGLGGAMYFVFGQKNFLSLGASITKLPGTIINHLINQFRNKKKIALTKDHELSQEEREKNKEIYLEGVSDKNAQNHTIEKAKEMNLPYIEAETPEVSIEQRALFETEYDNLWDAINGFKDTIANNPEQTFAPVVEWIFYIGVIFCLLPINALGNAKSSAEGAPTLVELLHDVGLPRLSEFIVGQLVAISCYIGSWGICGQAAHAKLSSTTPKLKKHPHMGDLLKRYADHIEPKKANPFADTKGGTIGHFFGENTGNANNAGNQTNDTANNTPSWQVPTVNWSPS